MQSFLTPTSGICAQRRSCAECVRAVPNDSTPCGWCASVSLHLNNSDRDEAAFARTGLCLAHAGRAAPAPFICPHATRRWIGAGDLWHACPDAAPADRPGAVWERVWTADGGLKVGEAFDAGLAAPVLQKYLLPLAQRRWSSARELASKRVLVPGCGRGYEVGVLAAAGFGHAEGWDVSATAAAAARLHAEAEAKEHTRAGEVFFRTRDFLEDRDLAAAEGPFDVILDYTFFAVLAPSQRARWAERVASLLAAGGELWTLIFPIYDETRRLEHDGSDDDDAAHESALLQRGGPPFSMSMRLLRSVLAPVGLVPIELRMLDAGEAHAGRSGSAGGTGASTALGRWVVAGDGRQQRDEL